jgi:gas vesicle protein
MSKLNVAIGTVAGVAAGALLGVLFAPEKGTETRRKLSDKSKETANSLKNKFAESFSHNGGNGKGEAEQMHATSEMS